MQEHPVRMASGLELLNRMTEEVAGVKVVAGPAEATAIGNCMVQARAAGLVADRWEYRRIVAEL